MSRAAHIGSRGNFVIFHCSNRYVAAAFVTWILLAAVAATRCQAQDLADYVSLIPVTDGNPATNDNGWANVEINATAFKNQSTVTVGDYQFISYYAADQKLVLGRRNLVTSPDQWYLLRTNETSANINDSHNVSTIGIDGDGYLHVAWGVHNNPLRYMKTDQSVLNDSPFTVPGNTAGQVPLQSGGITYPEFWNIPGSGDLLLTYRTGGSGNGEYQLARWNNAANSWDAVHAVSGSGNSNTGPQPWIDNDFHSSQAPPNANAYVNGLVYDSQNRLHTTWTWRTGGDSPTPFGDYQSNHNLMYAYSDNHGVDWRLADGTLLARNGVHDIDENNATPVINIPEGSSLINQSSSAIGPDDTLYVASWWAPDAAQGNHTRQYMLAAYNPYEPSPQWQAHQVGQRTSENNNNRVPESQLGSFRISRPIVLTDDDNRVFVVYSDHQRGQNVTVAYSESASRDDWQFVDLTANEDLNLWEPKYDVARWESDGVLSMLYQRAGQGLSPTPVSILEWDARAFFLDASWPPLTLQINRSTGETTIVNPAAETANLTAYSITSPGGQLGPAQWNSLADHAVAGWSESQALPTGLAESTDADPLAIAAAGSVSIGNPYVGQPIAFRVDAPADLSFHYTEHSVVRTGNIQYIGESLNNLTLLVDPESGLARLENTSPFAVSIDAYTVSSASQSLNTAAWTSLDDQGAEGNQWFEANVGPGRISELQASGATLLEPGAAFEMGQLFAAASDDQDLVFVFLLAGSSTSLRGVVLYTDVRLPGDYNDDGLVDAADYTYWRDSLGQSVAPGSGADGDRDGMVTATDFTVWKANFGRSLSAPSGAGAIASVPEPSAVFLVATLIFAGSAILRSWKA